MDKTELAARLVEADRRTSAAHVDTMRRLVLAAELKDPDTARHIVRISRYSTVLARGGGGGLLTISTKMVQHF